MTKMCRSGCFSGFFSAFALPVTSKAEIAVTTATKRIRAPNANQSTGGGMVRRTPNDHAGGTVKSSLSGAIQQFAGTMRGGDLDAMCRLDHCARHERSARLRHLPGDYSLAPNAGCGRLFSSSRTRDTPGQQARDVPIVLSAATGERAAKVDCLWS